MNFNDNFSLMRTGSNAQPGVVADGSRLHFGPLRQRLSELQRSRRAGKRARG